MESLPVYRNHLSISDWSTTSPIISVKATAYCNWMDRVITVFIKPILSFPDEFSAANVQVMTVDLFQHLLFHWQWQ